MSVVMRTTLPAAALGASVRRAAASIDPEVAVMPAMAMDDLVLQSPSVFLRRFPLFLVGAFAATALALAIVGIYGVVSYSVAQRTRELGIRTALGARPEALRSLVIRHGLGMAAVGVVVGGLAAMLAGRFAAKLLYGVTPTDPLVHTVVALVLATAAVVATLVPARRASRVDPAVALRAE
jgi:putative ABC transport system permease protein